MSKEVGVNPPQGNDALIGFKSVSALTCATSGEFTRGDSSIAITVAGLL